MPVPGKRVCKAICLFMGVSLLGWVCSRSLRGENGTAVGAVSKLSGSVMLEHHGHTSTAALSAKVLLNDRFTTSGSSSITITLLGGSELDVGHSSSIRIDKHLVPHGPGARSTVIGLLSGKLHSIVPYAQAQRSTFIVRTANAICGVRDTEFDTAYIEGKPCPGFPECKRYTDVGVIKGVVEVRSATNPKALPVRVAEGYETTVPCEIPPSSPSPLGFRSGTRCAPRMHWSESTRRTKTQASLPSEEAVLLLLFGLLRSGQVMPRRLVGWQDLNNTSRPEAA